MFNRTKPKTKLQLEIDRLVLSLDNHTTDSEMYGTIVDRLKELTKIQSDSAPASVSPDTKVAAAVNLLGIMLIIRHEHVNVVASKAVSFVQKLR